MTTEAQVMIDGRQLPRSGLTEGSGVFSRRPWAWARERKAHVGTFWWRPPTILSRLLFGWFPPVPCGEISPGHIISRFVGAEPPRPAEARGASGIWLFATWSELGGGLSPTLAVAPRHRLCSL